MIIILRDKKAGCYCSGDDSKDGICLKGRRECRKTADCAKLEKCSDCECECSFHHSCEPKVEYACFKGPECTKDRIKQNRDYDIEECFRRGRTNNLILSDKLTSEAQAKGQARVG